LIADRRPGLAQLSIGENDGVSLEECRHPLDAILSPVSLKRPAI
jgi:hypothetical protein